MILAKGLSTMQSLVAKPVKVTTDTLTTKTKRYEQIKYRNFADCIISDSAYNLYSKEH